MPIRIIEVNVPIARVPVFKQAAREQEIDFTDHPNDDGETVKFHMWLLDEYDLFSIGYCAGVENMYREMHGPLKDAIDAIESQQEKFKQNQEKNGESI